MTKNDSKKETRERKYGVLIGNVVDIQTDPADDKTPHYMIVVGDGNEQYKVNINCRSRRGPNPQVLYYVDEDFEADITNTLSTMDPGFHEVDYENNKNAEIAIDYIRNELVNPEEMNHLPFDIEGENDLRGFLDKNIKNALDNDDAVVYVFGQFYDNDGAKGIHNVHMNQGNKGEDHLEENQIYRDGCLFINFSTEDRWVSYFFAFQNQSWNTDDQGCPAVSEINI